MNKMIFKTLLLVGIVILASGVATAEEIKLTTIMPPSSGGGFSNFKVFNRVDSGTTWNVPAGITKIMVEVWGGGGGGGYYQNYPMAPMSGQWTAYYGGGSGGYCKAIFNVTPNTPYAVTVGSAGTSIGTQGVSGGNSSFGGNLMTASGGTGAWSSPGSGGNATVSNTAASFIVIYGAGGHVELHPLSGGGIGVGASTGGGGGSSGIAPGGGGSAGGSGGSGMVIVWW